MSVDVGKVVDGKVSGITNFGAFVELPDGKKGLVHISEIAEEYVKDVKSHLKQNQQVKVKIISIGDDGKISLSIKKAVQQNPRAKSRRPIEVNWEREKRESDNGSFEDRLSRFLKDSDEKMKGLKKNMESKRKSGGYRKSSQTF